MARIPFEFAWLSTGRRCPKRVRKLRKNPGGVPSAAEWTWTTHGSVSSRRNGLSCFDACQGPTQSRSESAQAEVLKRYCAAIYRYALKALGDADLADEACQEFAMRFVRGDFRHADPDRGRFRDYVKTAVIHLLGEIRRREQTRRRAMP